MNGYHDDDDDDEDEHEDEDEEEERLSGEEVEKKEDVLFVPHSPFLYCAIPKHETPCATWTRNEGLSSMNG